MDKHQFEIFYSGPSIDEATMDVKDLAPSLLALGELFQEANRVINKGESSVRVSVRAFKPGSFGVSLEVTSSLAAQLMTIFREDNLQDAGALWVMIFGPVGLFQLLKRLRGRKPMKAVTSKDGSIDLHVNGDGNKIEILNINQPVYDLCTNVPIRKHVESFAKPIITRGVKQIRAKKADIAETIDEDDAEALKAPPLEEQLLNEKEIEMVLSILTLSFQSDSWRFSDGQNRFWSTMDDKDFLGKVEANQAAFRKGDKLRVRLRMIQRQLADGELKTEYHALQVLEHIPGAYQIPIPLEGPKDREPIPV